jgi:hypothetical protein
MRRHLLATAVILTVAPGCDNVAWGGVEVRWEPPASAVPGTPADVPKEAVAEEAPPPEVPYPLLLAGTRDGTRATLVVVGEIRPEGIAAATDTSTSVGAVDGSEWILFTEGARVGRLTADEVDVASDFCPSTASLSGTLELVPTSSPFERILALPAAEARNAEYRDPRPLTHDYDQRVASLTFAQEAIPRLGAPWPEGGVLPTRLDVQSFQPVGATSPTLAATYLVRDQLAVGRPATGAYSVFILSSPVGGQMRETFEWYNVAELDGKKAPRYFAHLDWDGDGQGEIVLDVFGADRRWHAVLEQRENSWQRTFESPCGAGPSPGR